MSNYSICFSPTGGTQAVAQLLCGALPGSFASWDLCQDLPPRHLSPEDLCVVSVPSYGGRVPAVALERLRALDGGGAKAILVCVYGNRDWDDTLTELQDTLEEQNFVCAAAVAAVAEHSLFRQYAHGRPDPQDARQLVSFAHAIAQKLEGGVFGDLGLRGNHHRYKPFGGVPFHPEGSSLCDGCGLCARSCPAGAIDPADPRKTDTLRCISCMRCVMLCPRHARDLDPAMMEQSAAAMASKLGGHKENFLFL